jgi:hypothetical protein
MTGILPFGLRQAVSPRSGESIGEMQNPLQTLRAVAEITPLQVRIGLQCTNPTTL